MLVSHKILLSAMKMQYSAKVLDQLKYFSFNSLLVFSILSFIHFTSGLKQETGSNRQEYFMSVSVTM